jgi:hypothetical protein
MRYVAPVYQDCTSPRSPSRCLAQKPNPHAAMFQKQPPSASGDCCMARTLQHKAPAASVQHLSPGFRGPTVTPAAVRAAALGFGDSWAVQSYTGLPTEVQVPALPVLQMNKEYSKTHLLRCRSMCHNGRFGMLQTRTSHRSLAQPPS